MCNAELEELLPVNCVYASSRELRERVPRCPGSPVLQADSAPTNPDAMLQGWARLLWDICGHMQKPEELQRQN